MHRRSERHHMKKILSSGPDLASLSSKFEIDFQAEPLASPVLYAITGATGAGKSTLLDALCLALYEHTHAWSKPPRRVRACPTWATTQSHPLTRALLRRGAAEGFAEVDFGRDGVAYQSRSNVRRSRNRAEGKLQNSDISLTPAS